MIKTLATNSKAYWQANKNTTLQAYFADWTLWEKEWITIMTSIWSSLQDHTRIGSSGPVS